MISLGQKGHRLLHSLRRPQQSIARRILVEALPAALHKAAGWCTAPVPLAAAPLLVSIRFTDDVVNRLDRRSRVCFRTSPFSHAPPPLHTQRSYSPSPRSESGQVCPGGNPTGHQTMNRPAQILRRRHFLLEERIRIQVRQMKPLDHRSAHQGIQVGHVHHHAGRGIHRASHRNLDPIVMPMSMRVVALSVDIAILLRTQSLAIQPM